MSNYIKTHFILLIFLFSQFCIYAQLHNVGGQIYLQENAIVTIKGDLNNQTDGGGNSGILTVNNMPGTGQIVVEGNWTNSSVFNPGQSEVVLNGTNLQNVTTGGVAFYDLSINGTGNKNLLSDVIVSETLTLQSIANITTGSNVFEIALDGSVNRTIGGTSGGSIIGNLKKHYRHTATVIDNLTYEVGVLPNYYIPVHIQFNGLSSSGPLTVTSKDALHPDMENSEISSFNTCRGYWDINNTSLTYTTADLEFFHNQHVFGGNDFLNYHAASFSGSWMLYATPINTSLSTEVNITQIVAEYVVGEEDRGALNHAILKKKLDAGYYKTYLGRIYFAFQGEYNNQGINSGNLQYAIFDKDRNDLTPPDILPQIYGDNRYVLNLSNSTLNEGAYYVLEVTTEKGEKQLLRFQYTNTP